ncbi:MAG: cytochrome c biogenesis protein CcdA [Candidatus Eisenbacteria bacterium]
MIRFAEAPGTAIHGRPRALALWVACLALLLGAASMAAPGDDGFVGFGGGDTPTSVDVPVRVLLSHEALDPGKTGHLAVIYQIPDQSHVQLNDFFYVELPEGTPATLGAPLLPGTIEYAEEPVFQGKTTVFVPITLNADAPKGPLSIEVLAGYQACMEEPVFVCYAPDEKTVKVEFEVGGTKKNQANEAVFAAMSEAKASTGGEAASDDSDEEWIQQAEAPEGTDLAGKLEHALKTGSFFAFLIVFIGGVLTSFTPCVYPMIPITISYIGGSAKGKLGGFFLSLFFVLGIALMYSSLGLVASLTGGLFGSAMQSTPVLVVVGLVFFAMGASMLGAFDLAVPSGMQSKLQSGPRTGVIGAIFMGMVTGIVASPCVGPVLVVLLTGVAKYCSPIYGFFLLFTFACGLGLLFIIIGTFAGALSALPQAGQWMDTVKHVFGVILIAMGIYYVRTLIGPDLTWMALGLLVLIAGTFYGAFRPVPEHAEHGLLFRKGLGIAMVICGGFALLAGFAGLTGFQLAAAGGAAGGEVASAHPGLEWVLNDDEAARATAQAEGKPVVIDFYADWCGACKELDHQTWVDPTVQAEADRFVAIKMDFTEKSDWAKAKYAEYGITGLPTVIFLDSNGQEKERFFGFRNAESVLGSMKKLK